MTFQERKGIRFFRFDTFPDAVNQAIFTRQGGVSKGPWSSLNLGNTVGDIPEHVQENRRRSLALLGISNKSVYEVWQVHGREVVLAESPHPTGVAHLQADAIITNRPGLFLMMRFADCVPIFFYDPRKQVAGIAHAGWQGTVKGIGPEAVRAMGKYFWSNPADIIVGIGPSIGPDHYLVGDDLVRQVKSTFGSSAPRVLHEQDTGIHFNLWEANRLQLQEAGIKEIEMAEICTACHPEDWYSHRGESGRTGRFGAVIGLT